MDDENTVNRRGKGLETQDLQLSPTTTKVNNVNKVRPASLPSPVVITQVELFSVNKEVFTQSKSPLKSIEQINRKRHSSTSVKANSVLKESCWKYRLRHTSGKWREGELQNKFKLKVVSTKKSPTPVKPSRYRKGNVISGDGHRSVKEFLVQSVKEKDKYCDKEIAIKELSNISRNLRRLSQEVGDVPDNRGDETAQTNTVASLKDLTDATPDTQLNTVESVNALGSKHINRGLTFNSSIPNQMATGGEQEKGMGEEKRTVIEILNKEIEDLNEGLKKCEENSMEFMMKSLRLDMKQDSLRLMKEMQAVTNSNTEIKEEISTLRAEKNALAVKVGEIETTQTKNVSTAQKNTTEISEVRDEVTILRGIVAKHSQELSLLRQTNEEKEYFSMRNNLMIQGIEEEDEETSEVLKQLVTEFFSQKMKIRKSIQITGARRIGSLSPKIIQITLNNVKDKGVIYKHSKNLKLLRNNNDEQYYINDHLPLGMQEKQRKRKGIIRHDKSLSDNDQSDFAWKKGELYINNKKYQDPINPPTVEQTIKPIEDGDVIINKGEVQKNEGCRFLGYSAEVKTIRDVEIAYIKVRKQHPDALHVMEAHRIPGIPHSQLQNYQDDGEAGGGRALYQMLATSDIVHRAIFVVRYYGNHHLGPSRFESIQAAARSAIMRTTMNTILGKNQFLKQVEKRPNSRNLGATIAKSLRGGPAGGRGTGRTSDWRAQPPLANPWHDKQMGRHQNGSISGDQENIGIRPQEQTPWINNTGEANSQDAVQWPTANEAAGWS